MLSLILSVCVILLSGCSFSDMMSWGTGVRKDPDYQTWEKLSEKGKLDTEGRYAANAIHVTFAVNSYLEMHYYADPEKQNELPFENCYLLPGDSIYYSVEQAHTHDDVYVFDRLNIVSYDPDGSRIGYLSWPVKNDDRSVMIPYDYTGTEIAIEPSGHFGKRELILRDIVGEETAADGTWKVNSERVTAGTREINPLETITVEYSYNADNYYLVATSPDYWKADTDDGLVVFGQSDPKTGAEEYTIVLDTYLKAVLSVHNGVIYSVKDGESENDAGQKKELTIPRIRLGSTITLMTDTGDKNNISVNCALDSKIGEPREKVYNGKVRYLYDIEFGDTDRFMFIPSEYASEHGKLKFSVSGKEITERILLSTGMEIEYEAVETEDGYWLPNERGVVTVEGRETEKALRKIRFYPYRETAVLLEQPRAGGRIVYTVDGTQLSGSSVDLYCGTVIHMEFEAENGWESTVGNEAEYIVMESGSQVINIDGKSVGSVFRENEGHKPRLTVEINKNVDSVRTTVEASGIVDRRGIEVKEGNSIFSSFKTVISGEKIGTDGDIRFTFTNLDMTEGRNALRIIVDKETRTGNFREVHYTAKANDPVKVILHKDLEYISVSVQIEAVKAEGFKYIELKDADVEARFTDIKSDGDDPAALISRAELVSDERMLEITVRPNEGFFMTGSDTKNDIYSKKMKYEEYKRMDPAALEKQLKKVCVITFIKEDPYGDVEYVIDGQAVEGTLQVREGKEIVFRYILKDENYEIVADRNILTQAINLVDDSVTRKIEIKKTVTRDEFDGAVVYRKDFVDVREKVNH